MKRFSLIAAILEKDFMDSFKNRTVIFSILFPVLISVVFRIFLNPQDMPKMKLGVVNSKGTKVVEFFNKMSFGVFETVSLPAEDEAKSMIKEGKLTAAITLPDDFDRKLKNGESPAVDFWVDAHSISGASALEILVNRLIYLYNGQAPPAVLMVKSVQGPAYAKAAMLPSWILFTILGAFMVVSSSIIEEREKKTLQAILVTPCRLSEILIGKGLLGFLLTITGVYLILALNNGFTGNIFSMLLIVLAGSAFFTILGILIGLIMPGQTTVNVFGSILYMVMFMPVVMAEMNIKIKAFAQILPSFYVLEGVKTSMFGSATPAGLWFGLVYLSVFGLILAALSILKLNKQESL